MALLSQLQIPCPTVEHEPVFTMQAMSEVRLALDAVALDAVEAKTLLVQEDKGGDLALLVLGGEVRLDVKALKTTLGAGKRFSFAKPPVLKEVLATTPGSVSPLALINAVPPRPRWVLLDAHLMAAKAISVHPLENTASCAIAPADLVRFIRHVGFAPQVYDPHTQALTAP